MTRITAICDNERGDEPKLVGDILTELLAQYEAKFPGINVVVTETAAAAV